MIIARNTITLAHVTDIASVTWYYKLQASTATKPAKPTTDPPTGWTETEPTYTEGSTNSLYVCEKTVYTDDSYTYSEVSLSSSYEAAKLAYNKSVAAQNAAADALDQSVEYIVGTQTVSTGSWTGVTRDAVLKAGKTIAYKLPYAGSGNASLTLTLADGTTTAAIPVYSNTTRVTTHFGANSVITMTYDGAYWRAAGAAPSNTNYYDRTAYKASLTAEQAIAAGRIAVMNASGKLILLSTTPFDITGPILYVGTAYTSEALTQTNNYTMWGTPFSLTNTKTGFSGEAGKPIYIKGTLSGNLFTPDTEVFTCTVPTSKDGKAYILLGTMSTATKAVLNAEHPVYMYVGGSFKSTTQIAAEAQANIDDLDQQEIFNRLTNNGEEQGVYLEDGKLYLNFTYAVGQTLKIGGSNNKNGVIKLYDDDDNEWGSWSNDGLSMASGSSSVKLSPFSLQFDKTSHGYLQRSSVYGGVFTTGFIDASTGDIEFGVDIGSYLTSDPNAPFIFTISAEAVGTEVECGFVLNPYDDTDLIKVIGPTFFRDTIRFEAGTGALVGVSPQTDIASPAIFLGDNTGALVGTISSRYQTTGEVGIGLDAVRRLTNGTTKRSDLRILIDGTGNAIVHTSDQTAWRQGLGIRYGSAVNAVNIPSGSYTDRTYSFGHTFSNVPTVFISLTGSGDNAYRGDVTATVKAITATSVEVRFYNASAAALNVGLNWLAIGNDA